MFLLKAFVCVMLSCNPDKSSLSEHTVLLLEFSFALVETDDSFAFILHHPIFCFCPFTLTHLSPLPVCPWSIPPSVGLVMVGVIIGSRKVGINPDNVATPIAASLGDLITLSLLAGVSSTLYEYKGEETR